MPTKHLLFTNFFKSSDEDQLTLKNNNSSKQFKSLIDTKTSNIVLHPTNVLCMMCLKKSTKLEFVAVSNEFITNLYDFYRQEYRQVLIRKPMKKLFKDMNDFRDRVNNLVTDYYREEDQVPNYFRNIMDYKGGLLGRWNFLKVDSGFMKSMNSVCLDCFTKGNELKQHKFNDFDRTLDSRVNIPKTQTKKLKERVTQFRILKDKMKNLLDSK